MKAKTFVILLVATGVLVTLAYLRLGGDKPSGSGTMGDALFADLPVNTVTKMTIADSDSRVTLVKGDTVWQVAERNGYPADFDELRDTIVKLSRLKIGRRFSGSEDSLKRLSLMPPSAADKDSAGTQVTLTDASDAPMADLILGQARQAEGGGTGGQYLKMADTDTVFLVDNNFRFLKTAPAEWLQKEVLNIKSEQVSSVTCFADDNATPVYTLKRPEKGNTAQMTPVPEGREADNNKIDQVFDALAPFNLDDVAAAGESAAQGGPRLVYGLVDGRQITIFPASDGNDSYTIRVTADEAPAGKATAPDDSGSDAGGEPAASDAEDTKATPTDDASSPPKTAQQINEELGPWIFTVKKWQFDSFVTQPAGLLKALETEGQGQS